MADRNSRLMAADVRATLEPPRLCPECGRRLRVVVTPASWTATCRDHGHVGSGTNGTPTPGSAR